MAKKKWFRAAGLILVCHLTISACQASKEVEPEKASVQNRSSTSTKQMKDAGSSSSKEKKTASSTTKGKESSKSQTSDKEKAIPGVTTPTSDGFILTDQSKILSRTKEGIIVDHDGHSHFVFYADLQGTKFAHLIPSGTQVSQPILSNTGVSSQASAASTDTGHHYTFNPADIVAEDALGYTVRHDDHYHYILKSSLGVQPSGPVSGDNSGAANLVASGILVVPAPVDNTDDNQTSPSRGQGIAGIDYPTSDGFLFNGSGISGWTDLGLLVDHGGHLHMILKSDLARSKWAYLLPNQPNQPNKPLQPSQPITIAKPDKPLGTTQASQPTKPVQPSKPKSEEVSIKRTYLATATGLSEDKIILIDTPAGPSFMYPHGDHHHVVLLSKLDVTKPFDDGHGHDDPKDDDHHDEKPSVSDKDGFAGIDYPTSDGFLFDGTGMAGWTSSGLLVNHGGHTHILPKEALAKSKWAYLIPKEADDTEINPIELSADLIKQREDLAKQFGLKVEDIRVVTANGKVLGFEYPHEDHYDFVPVLEADSHSVALTDEAKRELTAYIRKTYGLLLGTPVTFHDGFVVFAIPHPHQDYDASRDYYSDVLDPRYDKGHVHPYAVPLSHLKVLTPTGIPELDFENELIAAAKRIGVSPSEVQIRNKKYFVLPGKDHDHYLNILTPVEGYEAYMANKLPDIKADFTVGDYSEATVIAEADRILAAAKDKYGEASIDYRRVARALETFKANLAVATTSTEGYLKALQSFEDKNIKGIVTEDDVNAEEVDPLTSVYLRLADRLKSYDEKTLKNYGINAKQKVEELKGFVAAKDESGLAKVAIHFDAIDRAKQASSDLAPRLAYMDYFLKNLDSDKLPASLRQEVIAKLTELQKISGLYRNPQKFREGLESTALLKERVKAALAAEGPAPDHANWTPYPRGFDRKEMANTVNSMREFLIKNKEITAEELDEGFAKRLELFPVHPKKPTSPVVTPPVQPAPEETTGPTEPSKPASDKEEDKPEKETEVPKPNKDEEGNGTETELSDEKPVDTTQPDGQGDSSNQPAPSVMDLGEDSGESTAEDTSDSLDKNEAEETSDKEEVPSDTNRPEEESEDELPSWRPIFEVPEDEGSDDFDWSGWGSILGTPEGEEEDPWGLGNWRTNRSDLEEEEFSSEL